MTTTCATCGAAPATVRDLVVRGGTWVTADVCADCARKRRMQTNVPLLGAALSAVALAFGATFALERMSRGEQGTPAPSDPREWAKRVRGVTPTLSAYSRDLTEAAKAGELDPVIGRDNEVDRVVAILSRRSKNNPVLVGEPGVGKTAIVEGLAQRIVDGRVPQQLKDKRVLALALGPLVAGTKYRGEFEGRVKKIVDEIKRSAGDVILFIDELHTLVGAGAAEGSLDLSSMIKPELARGELQCVGATTFDDYRKYVESDAALERRFQPVMVEEPSIEATIHILRGLRSRYAKHHGVDISDAAVDVAASLAARYIPDRFLPDKAIDLMDEAAASVALRNDGSKAVAAEDVSAVVSRWTGIPQGTLTEAQTHGLLTLEDSLRERIAGQEAAIATVADAVRRGRAGLKDPRRPLGSFLFAGPSGVGKTELSRALSAVLFGTDDALVRVDLSEYTEGNSVSRLIGAPPGYVGHDEAGQLTEPVRRRPYCVVLFDEIDKAHADVTAILLQILDDGRVTDAKGRAIDFRHAIVIVTSNIGLDILRAALRPELLDRFDEIVQFKVLGVEDIERIVETQMREVAERTGGRRITIVLADDARRFIAHESIATGGGARYVSRTIARLITTPLSSAILRGDLKDGSTARFELRNETIALVAA
jgi:ATP-dependent Clp protease ATP-binding subunit ClpC